MIAVDEGMVKKLGQKARERFEEERKKRKEIVRLEESIVPNIPAKRKGLTTKAKVLKPQPLSNQPQSKGDGNKSIDDDETSNVVEMVGLPWKEGTYPNVVSFWNGLNVSQVFILPTYKRNAVYCRFESPATANFACQRSGECVKTSSRSYAIQVALFAKQVEEFPIMMTFTTNSTKNQTFYDSWQTLQSIIPPQLIPFLVKYSNRRGKIKYNDCKNMNQLVETYNSDCQSLENYQKLIQKSPHQYASNQQMGDVYLAALQLLLKAESILENHLNTMEQLFFSHNNKLPLLI